MNIVIAITEAIKKALLSLEIETKEITLEHPADLSHGDYSTNVAMVYAKELKTNPRILAEKIKCALEGEAIPLVEKIEIAGPGFINFHLATAYFTNAVEVIAKDTHFGNSERLAGKKILFEYTQPNPFKEFHIGHMMNNVIGEALSRITEAAGAEVKRATYHGDVGLHVAKTLWGVGKLGKPVTSIKVLGEAYACGNSAYETDEIAKGEIVALNKKIYERSDEKLNALYDVGKKISLEHFEVLYKKLGSSFDFHFYESESGPRGKKIVEEKMKEGIFEKSEGAVIFKGENYGLHTRVFLNKEGLPTYEAKDLGLTQLKLQHYAADELVIITANEQSEYFKVIAKAIETVFPELFGKVIHLSHGMLKLPSGKMSSRTGTIVSAADMIDEIEVRALEEVKDRGYDKEVQKDIAQKVALAAIKYSIVKQAIGSDVIFDVKKSLSFEGDSGPYLQYSCVRARSIVAKAPAPHPGVKHLGEVSTLEKMLYRFSEVVEKAGKEFAPHYVATYLIELAAAFNNYYAHNQIINEKDPASPYRVMLTHAFSIVMTNGLALLGIEVPEKM